jgi:integrase/recombinase XerD
MSPSLEAFVEYIEVIKGLSPKTVEAYKSDLIAFESSLNKPMIEMKHDDVFSFVSSVSNRRTLNRKLSAANAFFSYCFKHELKDDEQKFRLSKIPKYLPRYLEIDEIRKGLDLIDRTTWLGMRDYALILFLFATGTRISEALSVEYNDLSDAWVKIRFAKGEKERIVPIASEALDALKLYRESTEKKTTFLWQNYKHERLSRVSAFKITQKYLGVSPHVLRHSYATAMILGGADLRVVQDLLGHSSMLTTQIYTHIEKSVLRDTVLRYHPLKREDYEIYS